MHSIFFSVIRFCGSFQRKPLHISRQRLQAKTMVELQSVLSCLSSYIQPHRLSNISDIAEMTGLWYFGFLYWIATVFVSCRAYDCSTFLNGCNCTATNMSGFILQNCNNPTRLNLAKLYQLTNSKQGAILIRNSTDITLFNDGKFQIREVQLIIENVHKVEITNKTFDQIVINAVFRNITNLNLCAKSFASCWGTVWLFNSEMTSGMTHAFSSSDMVVYNDNLTLTENPFTIHVRPNSTPLQKFNQVYEISSKIADLEITIYAVLALIGAVILTLISLTIVVAKKFVPPSYHNDNLPDVVRIPPLRKRNPVTKLSRTSRVVFHKRVANKDRLTPGNYQLVRPPLPPPRDI